jgi:hypothetical protein
MVDLHLKPDTLHCGVDHGFHKKLRDLTGRETNLSIDSIHWREKEKRVIDIGQLADDIQNLTKAKNFSAADFALEMIEGAPKVRFCFPSAPTGH